MCAILSLGPSVGHVRTISVAAVQWNSSPSRFRWYSQWFLGVLRGQSDGPAPLIGSSTEGRADGSTSPATAPPLRPSSILNPYFAVSVANKELRYSVAAQLPVNDKACGCVPHTQFSRLLLRSVGSQSYSVESRFW